MNQLNNLDKLSTILKAFGYGKPKNESPKLWNLNTSPLTILERFHKKLVEVNLDLFEHNILKVVKNGHNSKLNAMYRLLWNEYNITPITKKNNDSAAKGTLNQYLRVLNYFDLIILNSMEDDVNSIIKNEGKIYFSINIFEFIYSKSVDKWLSLERIIDFIVQGINKTIDGYKDIAFSLFLCIMYSINKDLVFELIDEEKVFYKKENKQSFAFEIKNNYDSTYKRLVKFIIDKVKDFLKTNSNYEVLDCLINLIYSRLKNEEIKFTFDSLITDNEEKLKLLEQDNLIQNYRSKLRENILKTRKPTDDKYYSDITPIDKNVIFYHDAYEQQEAAHILDVWRIKDNFEINDESLNYLSDPNNGILIDHIYHDALDNGWISFNTKGEMIPKDKWNEYYGDEIMSKKYPLMKIKDEVFNENMKQYLINRNLIPGTKHSK